MSAPLLRTTRSALTALAVATLLASCGGGGGGDEPAPGAAAADPKDSAAQRRKLPAGTPVNADAHVRGQFGPPRARMAA